MNEYGHYDESHHTNNLLKKSFFFSQCMHCEQMAILHYLFNIKKYRYLLKNIFRQNLETSEFESSTNLS